MRILTNIAGVFFSAALASAAVAEQTVTRCESSDQTRQAVFSNGDELYPTTQDRLELSQKSPGSVVFTAEDVLLMSYQAMQTERAHAAALAYCESGALPSHGFLSRPGERSARESFMCVNPDTDRRALYGYNNPGYGRPAENLQFFDMRLPNWVFNPVLTFSGRDFPGRTMDEDSATQAAADFCAGGALPTPDQIFEGMR